MLVYQRVHPVIQSSSHPVIHDDWRGPIQSSMTWSQPRCLAAPLSAVDPRKCCEPWPVARPEWKRRRPPRSWKASGEHNNKFWLKLWIFIQSHSKKRKFWIVLEDPVWHFGTSVLRQTGKVRATIDQTSWLRPGNHSSRALDEADLYWCPCILL